MLAYMSRDYCNSYDFNGLQNSPRFSLGILKSTTRTPSTTCTGESQNCGIGEFRMDLIYHWFIIINSHISMVYISVTSDFFYRVPPEDALKFETFVAKLTGTKCQAFLR